MAPSFSSLHTVPVACLGFMTLRELKCSENLEAGYMFEQLLSSWWPEDHDAFYSCSLGHCVKRASRLQEAYSLCDVSIGSEADERNSILSGFQTLSRV